MNNRVFLLVLGFALLATGCVPASLEPASATPEIMPRLDPSPTPSDSTLPFTCQATDLNVYINEMDGYCFAYPTRFTLGDQPSDNPGVYGPKLDDSLTPTQATFGIEITPANPDQTLREQAEAYVKKVSERDPSTYTWTQLQVGGEPAWMVEPIPSIRAWRYVFILHHGSLFRLCYWPVDDVQAKPDIDELTQTTLGSFTFLK